MIGMKILDLHKNITIFIFQINISSIRVYLYSDFNFSHDYYLQIFQMSQTQDQVQPQTQGLDIESLEEILQKFLIDIEDSLIKFQQSFKRPEFQTQSLKIHHDIINTVELKFKQIMLDLNTFLITQELESTPTLRNVFFKIIENPLFSLFKTSRYDLLELSLNGFDIEIQPIEALKSVYNKLVKKIVEYNHAKTNIIFNHAQVEKKIFKDYQSFIVYSLNKQIQFKIFILYSYMRKGVQLFKKTYENRLFITEMFSVIQKDLVPSFVANKNLRGLKQISILNLEIFNIEPSYDYFYFYFSIPIQDDFLEIFLDILSISQKCIKNNNYNIFIIFFLKHHKNIIDLIKNSNFSSKWIPYLTSILSHTIKLLRCGVCGFEQLFSLIESILRLSKNNAVILLQFITSTSVKIEQSNLIAIQQNYINEVAKNYKSLLQTLKQLDIQQIAQRIQNLQLKYFFSINFIVLYSQQSQYISICDKFNSRMPQLYFEYMEPTLKACNNTINITNKHKYIDSQFNIINQGDLIIQQIQQINNFLFLSKIYPKDYEILFESKFNVRFLFDFASIINQNYTAQLKNVMVNAKDTILQTFLRLLLSIFSNLKRYKQNLTIEQKIKYLNIFSLLTLNLISQTTSFEITVQILQEIENIQYQVNIPQLFQIIFNLNTSNQRIRQQTFKVLENIAFSDLYKLNEQIKQSRFHQIDIRNILMLQNESQSIIKNYDILNKNILVAKNNNIFKYSSGQQLVNQLNLQSKIDEIFFSLNYNSKKCIQILLSCFVQQIQSLVNKNLLNFQNKKLDYINGLLIQFSTKYSIIIPYLNSLKININNIKLKLNTQLQTLFVSENVNFIQFVSLIDFIAQQSSIQSQKLIQTILNKTQIRFLNGKNYVTNEIGCNVIQFYAKLINIQIGNKSNKSLMVKLLNLISIPLGLLSKYDKYHIELIKNIIELIKYNFTLVNTTKEILNLCEIYQRYIQYFFRSKEQQLNRNSLYSVYLTNAFNTIINYNPVHQTKIHSFITIQKLKTQTLIPFTLSFDYDLQQQKFTKSETLIPADNNAKQISINTIINNLSERPTIKSNVLSTFSQKSIKEIDLRDLRHNLQYIFGEQFLEELENKTQTKLLTNDRRQDNTTSSKNFKQNEQTKNIVMFYMKQFTLPQLSNSILEALVVELLEGCNQIYYLKNQNNLEKILDILIAILHIQFQTLDKINHENNGLILYLIKKVTNKQTFQVILNKILQFFTLLKYSNIWAYNPKLFNTNRLPSSQILFNHYKINTQESYLSIFLRFTLEKYNNKTFSVYTSFSKFLKTLFLNRPKQNLTMPYKVQIDKSLLNLILKCIDLENLNSVSILFNSNFENLRIYTDDIQEGFKSLNLASKTRSYNEYLILSKQFEDSEYLNPLKIFKQNLKFFIMIQKEGYQIKYNEEKKILNERLVNLIKYTQSQNLTAAFDNNIDEFFKQVHKLKNTSINRIKSLYLAAKLRDLTIQNSITINIIHRIFNLLPKNKIIQYVNQIQIFSLVLNLHYQILMLQNPLYKQNSFKNYQFITSEYIDSQMILSTTRRFGFHMDVLLEKLDFQFDEVLQNALTNIKSFLLTDVGREWAQNYIQVNPGFFINNKIKYDNKRNQRIQTISKLIEGKKNQAKSITIRQKQFINDIRREMKCINTRILYNLKNLEINLIKQNGTQQAQIKINFNQLFYRFKKEIISLQLLLKLDDGTFIFNKNKFSEDSLQLFQILGLLCAASIYQKLPIGINLHNSIICQILSRMIDFDDLINIDFNTWEYLKMVLAQSDCKNLNLTFSYQFQSEKNPKQKQRIQLIEKGTSKKVNNLNRQQYCDLICGKILYDGIKLPLRRFLVGIFKVLPKQYLCCLKYNEVLNLFYGKQNLKTIKKLQFQQFKKFGLILPDQFSSNQQNFQNLKDSVNINWLIKIIQALDQEKFIKFVNLLGQTEFQFVNLEIYTRTSQKESLEIFQKSKIIINHFKSQQAMEKDLKTKLQK